MPAASVTELMGSVQLASAKKVLEVALAVYPASVEREEVDERTDYKRSSRDTYIQKLQARQLLVRGAGAIQANQELF